MEEKKVEKRRVSFSNVSGQRGFYFENQPLTFVGEAKNVPTETANGQGFKTYRQVAPMPSKDKFNFYREGAYLGVSDAKERQKALQESQGYGLVRRRGANPTEWAEKLHEVVNENVNDRTCWQKVCNALGQCFCLRRGGKTRRRRSLRKRTRKHKQKRKHS